MSRRKLGDYYKVQRLVSWLIRGRSIFVSKESISKRDYLDIGCGPNIDLSFVNLDYLWRPGIDVCWDLNVEKLPFPDQSFKGVFTEHCFEHLTFDKFKANMKEIFRTLKPGGTLRLIMPDGEIYVDAYSKRKNDESVKLPFEEGYISPMARINGIFRNHGHLFIYDFETVRLVLEEIGFSVTRKCEYKKGVDEKLLRDTEWRAVESLYVEATR